MWKWKVLKWSGMVLAVLALAGAYVWFFEQPSHSDPATHPKAFAVSGNKILDSIRKGAEYLKIRQESNGHFAKGALDPAPAFTAMVVDALARSPDKYREKDFPFIQKAVDGILSYQKEDGSICTSMMPLQTYVTSVSIMALTALKNPAHKEVIEKAKQYLRTTQNQDVDSVNLGGAGYAKNGKISGDVSGMWVEAMHDAGVKKGDPAFTNAEKFFSRLQNDPETNKAPPVEGTELSGDGGMMYSPGKTQKKIKPGMSDSGKQIATSYDMMTYAGLKSFLYMDVDKKDPRVQSAFRWIRNNYTLETNRHLGADGLYYFYMTMAKALAIYGEPFIETSDGVRHNWAQELSDKVISLQNEDGHWKNNSSKEWMENDSVLVSCYAIRTLTVCYDFLKNSEAALSNEAKK